MSSSNTPNTAEWGTIYMGPSNTDETTVSRLEGGRSMAWDETTEAQYLTRVRERAAKEAGEIMKKARAEAEQLKQQALQEGYQEGLAQAQQELEEFQQTMGDSVSGVLGAIQGQCSNIFQQWRHDLVTILRISVERAVGLSLSEERMQILEKMFHSSVEQLDSQKQLVIRVSPEDEPAVNDIVSTATQRYQGLEAWSVKADKSIGPGGMIVESLDSIVDNTIEARTELVQHILDQLTLPESDI